MLCVCVNRWVMFENPAFSGEVYVLEKGLYSSPEDWGGHSHRISSVQPVIQVTVTIIIIIIITIMLPGC